MCFFSLIKKTLWNIKSNFIGNSVDNLIWIVNVLPRVLGFSLVADRINPLFWIIHLSLSSYLDGVGVMDFVIYHAQGATELIKSYVNVTMLILIFNNSFWLLTNKSLIKSLIAMAKNNDNLVSKRFEMSHQRLLSTLTIILLIIYGFYYFIVFAVYLPTKLGVDNAYCMTLCVGMEPLTQSPNREICMFMLCISELTVAVMDLTYQALLCLLIAHTAIMYIILSEEINQLNVIVKDGNEAGYFATTAPDRMSIVKEKLHSFTTRHCMILETIQKIKDLYSMPIGVNFMANAVSTMLFFFLSFEEYVAFSPILIYGMLILFLYCFLCQRLVNASEEFERAVYSCGWENLELSEKKVVYNMLVSAQRPIELLAAYIVPVNIATFASTCQIMYQFVTVVKLEYNN